ncbi:TetR/AcrR family transcriptional regulator [Pseudarthrobacter sp. NamE5]|uniref:TetR/AcrR family transcriptional regulator n=1 Tax=Pseudarthrobacter sp. NamE5 TaxID=2576839 RepID=UPI00110AE745|nr:TetR/AcrR family transcriptional regulator [Pseudarthrobacter sp. NamE5]TLM88088.1 TetR/AcrR family transcriptional regulator [Pseudarthrobacter sp. NamE5]
MSPEAKVPQPSESLADSLMAPAGSADRIMAVAYELFSQRGVRDVGVNELIERSGVAKATFYRHFPSKDSLVLAFLEQRDRQWTMDMILSEARRRGSTPTAQLLAVFDVFGEWFLREDFEACSFVRVLLEMGPAHPLGQASIAYLDKIRGHVQAVAEEAGLVRPDEFARSLLVLMKGSVVQAAEGDMLAAGRAQQMAGWLVEHHRA